MAAELKPVLVTGGNAGIGKALCKLLATEHGCQVFMGARSLEKGAAAVADIEAEAPTTKGKIFVVQCDTQSDASCAAAAATVKAALGGRPLYAIVNNAGAGLAHGVKARTIIDTNLYGPKRVCDAFLPLVSTTDGRVVNVGSGIGPGWMSRASADVRATLCSPQVTWEQVTAVAEANLAAMGNNAQNGYGLSKATLMAFSSILAREQPQILTSTISPGFIDTAMTRGFGARLTPEQGTVSIRHCLFAELRGNGWMYGSDAKRSPIDASRDPGDPEYTDPTGRGW